jgi:hypothetical protein
MMTIDDFVVAGQRVLVRDDFNVPLDGGRVTDDGRIRAALPTLSALLDRDAKVIVCAHLGRPAGQTDPRYSLAPVAARLGELLGRPVELAADTAGPSAQAAVAAMSSPHWPACTSRTGSASCTANKPVSTMSPCASRTRPATWSGPKSPRSAGSPRTSGGPTWWCSAARRWRTSSTR